jgi:DNA-binding HxlR family transcriptional regulator
MTIENPRRRQGQAKARKSDPSRRSTCAVACTLDLVGDKWSLLVVRDMLHGKRTYGELLDSPEGIPTNLLADRLKRLEDAGIIASSAYQERPVRYAYTLTEQGKALGQVLLAMIKWGRRFLPGTETLKTHRPADSRRGSTGRSAGTRATKARAS